MYLSVSICQGLQCKEGLEAHSFSCVILVFYGPCS